MEGVSKKKKKPHFGFGRNSKSIQCPIILWLTFVLDPLSTPQQSTPFPIPNTQRIIPNGPVREKRVYIISIKCCHRNANGCQAAARNEFQIFYQAICLCPLVLLSPPPRLRLLLLLLLAFFLFLPVVTPLPIYEYSSFTYHIHLTVSAFCPPMVILVFSDSSMVYQ